MKARVLHRVAGTATDHWPQVRSFANLHAAWRAARLGKRNCAAVAPVRDRVLHPALIRMVEPILNAGFSPFSFACRTGKGVHAAADHYQQLEGRYAYVLKLDVASCFPSVFQGVVLAQLERRLQDVRVLDLFQEILGSYASERGTGRGLPIGNLTSQVLANVHLDDLDHFIIDQLCVPGYLRYVDDLFLLDDDKARPWRAAAVVEAHLQGLGLALKPTATRLRRTSERVDVLGYLVTRDRRWLRNGNGYR